MNSVLVAENLTEWEEATRLLQANEAVAAVYTVVDEDAATQAVDYVRAPEMAKGLLLANRLPKEFLDALIISHRSSHPVPLEALSNDSRWPIYTKGATGLHIDGYVGIEKDKNMPLNNNFTCQGSVEICFVPITEEQIPSEQQGLPNHLSEMLTDDPGSECEVVAGLDFFLPPTKAKELGSLVTVTAGQLVAFSGHADLDSGRLPVAHQFISQGESATERNSRAGCFIRTDWSIEGYHKVAS